MAALINLGGASPIAYLMLILWVPFGILMYSTLRPPVATMIVVLGGTLLLPEVLFFDFPLIPPLDKHGIVCLSGFIGIMIRNRRQFFRTKPFSGIGALVYLLFGSIVATTLTNMDPVPLADRALQGTSIGDINAQGVRDMITLALPFVIGRASFRTQKDLREVVKLIAVFGVLYSLLALLEIRLSPQLHRWIYGYHQHSFSQTFRWGGYRPTIFLAHGIAIGMWFMAAATATIAHSRVSPKLLKLPSKAMAVYMSILFIFIKSTGAIVYALAAFPAAWFTSAKFQLRLGMILAVLAGAYPALKVTGLFPEEEMVNLALSITADRADSLQDRFDNDIMLTNRARERILFGWGPYGRGRVYDDTGKDISVTDGWWIIQLGGRGAVGLGILFGFLLLPIFYLHRNQKKIPDKKDRLLLGSLSLCCVFYVIDLMPNGLYNSLPFFLSGMLLGLTEGIIAAAKKAQRAAQPIAQPRATV